MMMNDERRQIVATKGLLGAWYIAAVLFLFGPLVAAVVYSFNLGVVNKETATLTGCNWWTRPGACTTATNCST